MVKKLVRSLVRSLGFDIIKYKPPVTVKSVKTGNLSFYETATGNYYLPTDAKKDIVANTIINNGILKKKLLILHHVILNPGLTCWMLVLILDR